MKNLEELQNVTARLVALSADVEMYTDFIVNENSVIEKLQEDLDREIDDGHEDSGEVFGFSVGMVKGSTYKKILEMIIDDKKELIEDWASEVAGLKVLIVKTISGVTEEPKEEEEEDVIVCPHCSMEMVYSIDGDTCLEEKWSCPNCD
jgi:hypothetical protein